MKLIEIVNAVIAIDELRNVEIEDKTAYALYITKNAILPQYNFFGEEERKLVNKYAKRDGHGKIITNGMKFEFASPEAQAEYAEKMSALFNMDVDVDFKRYKIKMPSKIKMVYLEALKNFFDFDIPEIEAENDNSRTESQ